MATEDQIEALERAKRLVQDKVTEIESALSRAKADAQGKMEEIEKAIADVRNMSRAQAAAAASVIEQQVTQTEVEVQDAEPLQDTVGDTIVPEESLQEPVELTTAEEPKKLVEEPKKPVETRRPVERPRPAPRVEATKQESKRPPVKKKEPEPERKPKQRNNEKEQITKLAKALDNRTKGRYPAEEGNKDVKHTDSEVFIYVVDDNALQLKVLVEKFRNTRSFKKAKGFASGKECLDYLKTHRFPKKSMIMVVVDFYLEPNAQDPEETVTGIDVLTQLKEYDPDIEVIILSSSDDIDISASATRFGALSFIKKGEDDF
jgi:CheY-like chemotaxis protein